MIRAKLADGTVLEFPDGTADEVVDRTVKAHVTGAAPAEAAPDEPKTPSGYSHPLARFGSGAVSGVGRGLLSLIDLPSMAKAAVGVARVPERLVKSAFSPRTEGLSLLNDVADVAQGVKTTGENLVGMHGPEAMGGAVGELLPSALPVGKILGAVGDYAKSSRAANIVKATGASKLADIKKIEKMASEGRIDLPVSATRGSIGKYVRTQIEDVAGPNLDKAKAVLPGLPDMSIQDAIDNLTKRRNKLISAKGAAGDRPLLDALDNQIAELKTEMKGGSARPESVQGLKEQFQGAATPAYKVSPGMAEGATAAAKKMTAKELRKALENTPGTEALTAANRAMEPLMAMKAPLETQRLGGLKVPSISRSAEMLVGRGLVPAMVGGGALMGGPMGAAVGLGVGAFMQSALWNTLSAAGKAKVGPILASEGVQAAVQAAFAAHIAENAARRGQEPQQ